VRPGEQGIAPSPVFLLPQTLPVPVPAQATSVTAKVSGTARLDALLVQPVVSHLGLAGTTSLDVYVNATKLPVPQKIAATGPVTATAFDATGHQVGRAQTVGAHGFVVVPPGGFTTVTPR